jgi:glyoxylase-like metal-dependent hydrolase (beta-lactamase superfamily II)/predicted ester cyclase
MTEETAVTTATEEIARAYFDAIADRDVEAAVALWRPGGRENVRGFVDTTAPDGVREFLGGMLAAMPDAVLEVLSVTVTDDRAAVQWRAKATFAGAPYDGIAPTGSRVILEGCDLLRIADGRIVANDAYVDGMGFARQIGMLPAQGSGQEQAMTKAFNARTKIASKLHAGPVEQIAPDVWLVRGGVGRSMNVFLVREPDGGVFAFDAGIRVMAASIASAAAGLGGLTKVVLGHGHEDHRGAAPGLGVPVLCHPNARADAEGDGGRHYFKMDLAKKPTQVLMPRLLSSWDGGPVAISGTVQEGDELGDGFRVVLLEGHAPGQIALFRERDGLALTTDVFYTLDPETGRKGHARVPHAAFNYDTEQARAAIRKLAELGASAAWPGHADAVTGDVRSQLLRAADTT